MGCGLVYDSARVPIICTGLGRFQWNSIQKIQFQRNLDAGKVPASGSIAIKNLGFSREYDLESNAGGSAQCPAGYQSVGLTPPGPGWFRHCRPCCCYIDNPTNLNEKHCYEHGDILGVVTPGDPFNVNHYCQGCHADFFSFAKPILELYDDSRVVPCDDGESCTWNDQCNSDGLCVAEVYNTCLIKEFQAGDPTKDCEMCDGTGPFSPTRGCVAKPGSYVFGAGTDDRVCACFIDGQLFPHGALRPGWPCQRCDVSANVTGWSLVPDDSRCDRRAQLDYANFEDQDCSEVHTCLQGICGGSQYTCPPLQECQSRTTEFPYLCDLSGPNSFTAGCTFDTRGPGHLCRQGWNGCVHPTYCNGVLSTCGNQVIDPGVIYEGSAIATFSDGDSLAEDFPVSDSSSLGVRLSNWTVSCDNLYVAWAIMKSAPPPAEAICSLDTVDFDDPHLGYLWQPTAVAGRLRLTPPGVVYEAKLGSRTSDLMRVQTHQPLEIAGISLTTTNLTGFVDSGCNCIRHGVLSFDVKLTDDQFSLWQVDLGSYGDRGFAGYNILVPQSLLKAQIEDPEVGLVEYVRTDEWIRIFLNLPWDPVGVSDADWLNTTMMNLHHGGPVPTPQDKNLDIDAHILIRDVQLEVVPPDNRFLFRFKNVFYGAMELESNPIPGNPLLVDGKDFLEVVDVNVENIFGVPGGTLNEEAFRYGVSLLIEYQSTKPNITISSVHFIFDDAENSRLEVPVTDQDLLLAQGARHVPHLVCDNGSDP